MKSLNIRPVYILAAWMLILTGTSCRKTVTDAEETHDPRPASRPQAGVKDSTQPPIVDTVPVHPPYPQSPPPAAAGCNVLPIYGDTIVYPQPAGGQDYILSPVNNPGTGKYFSWPEGMVIDANTGAINLTRSETGLKYAIGFVKDGSTDTCLSTLVVGGAAYMDSVYVIADGQKTATPYFEANPYLPSVCAGGGCSFDVTGSAGHDKVIVNGTTGVIDLEKTLNGSLLSLGGAFGLLPVNGATITTNIYYRLNDPSNSALQHIAVQLQYYDTKANISPGLLGGIVNSLNNLLSGNLISLSANPRPPLIVIVRRPY